MNSAVPATVSAVAPRTAPAGVSAIFRGAMHLGLALILGAAMALAIPAHAQDTTGELEQSSATSSKEKISFASSAIEEMSGASKDVAKMLADAEKEGDVFKVQCLNKKLAAIRALNEVSQSASANMQDAIGAGVSERADLEFRKIVVALSKVRQFRAEAEACLGEGGAAPGSVDVDVTNEELEETPEDSIASGDVEVGVEAPGITPFE